MKEKNESSIENHQDDGNRQTSLNIVNNKNRHNQPELKSELKRVKSMNQYINTTLDNIGFTRYHLLLFITNALFLFCEGMHEIIHIILLSMINEKHNLSHYHLAFMNSIEYLGYSISTLLVSEITNYIKRKYAILITVFGSLLCTGLSITSYNFILYLHI